MESYRSQAAELGRPRPCRADAGRLRGRSYLAAVDAIGDAIVAEQLFYYNGLGNARPHPNFTSPADFTIDALWPHLVIGAPADCIEAIEHLQGDLDVDTLVLRFRFPFSDPPPSARNRH